MIAECLIQESQFRSHDLQWLIYMQAEEVHLVNIQITTFDS